MSSLIPFTDAPILIAGPTASGKSALALRLAELCDGWIINADAIQVYDCWSILSARPSSMEAEQAPHYLYGHIGKHTSYSTGHWLREVKSILEQAKTAAKRPIIIGGTGLYFTALTQGLAEIPSIPNSIRDEGNKRRRTHGKDAFLADLQRNDPETLASLDQNNPARLQRAWEVFTATGKGLSAWHAETPPPLVAADHSVRLLLNVDRDWLANRIDHRFDLMMKSGALEEVRDYCADGWDANLPSAQAIGAAELVAYMAGEMDLTDATETAKAQTRQYAKRQRTWFRSKMKSWQSLDPEDPISNDTLIELLKSTSCNDTENRL